MLIKNADWKDEHCDLATDNVNNCFQLKQKRRAVSVVK